MRDDIKRALAALPKCKDWDELDMIELSISANAEDWLTALVEVFDAAKVTLKDNAHLADGDNCTLKALRDACRKLEE